MEFMVLLLFILFCTSITNIVVNSTILDFPRDFIIARAYDCSKPLGEVVEKLLSCMMCSGFWIGLILSLFFSINPIVGAGVISLTSHFYGTTIEALVAISEISESLTVEDAEE